MGKQLTEEYFRAHTIGELRSLSSPIHIADYNPAWPHRFHLEVDRIRPALGAQALRIEHVGPTSVPDLPAKPVIDILLVVEDSSQEAEYAPAMDVNLHVFSTGYPEIDRMLAFRDRLRSNARDRELYACGKRALAQQDWKYTQNYADAKTAIVEEIIARAQS